MLFCLRLSLFPRHVLFRGGAAVIIALPFAFSVPCGAARAQALFSASETEPTLAHALQRVRWNASQRGPLLVIGAENVRLKEVTEEDRDAPGAGPGDSRLLLAPVAERFERIVSRLPTLTVLAPTTMTLLALPPSDLSPAAFARLGKDRAAKDLLATFTDDQWKRAGSASGIGFSDLTDKQKAFWNNVVPDPFVVQKVTAAENGGYYSGDGQIGEGRALSPSEREGIRLRLQRTVYWNYNIVGNGNSSSVGYGLPTGPQHRQGETFYIRASRSNADGRDTEDPRTALGAALRPVVPNQRKKSELDYAQPALNAVVNLAGARTLAEVVNRAAQASGLEIYADPRLGRLSVTLGGVAAPAPGATAAPTDTPSAPQTARAGDILGGVALAVTGTFRRVGDDADFAYVLTDDLAGLAPRRARLREWYDDSQQTEWGEDAALKTRMAARAPLPFIGWAPDYPFALPDTIMRAFEERLASGESEPRVPVALLPQSIQNQVKTDAERHTQSYGGGQQLRTDSLALHVSIGARFVVPGIGEFDAPGVASLSDLLPKKNAPSVAAVQPVAAPPAPVGSASLPPALTRRALFIAPDRVTAPADAVALARAARRAGFTDLWIEPTSDSAGDEETASVAAVWTPLATAAREAGLRPLLAVRVLSARQTVPAPVTPSKTSSAAPAQAPPAAASFVFDINLLGETGAAWAARRLASMPDAPNNAYYRGEVAGQSGKTWRATDGPNGAQEIAARLARLVQSAPGNAGLVLLDTAAPGYLYGPDAAPNYGLYRTESEMGYTPRLRLAALRASNADPVDLSNESLRTFLNGGDLSLPFFPDEPASAPRYVRATADKSPSWTLQEKNDVTPYSAFNRVRRDANAALIRAVGARLRDSHPTLPVVVAARDADFPNTPYFYGTWDKPDQIPERQPGQSITQTALALSPQARFVSLRLGETTTPALLRKTLQTNLPKFLAAPGQSAWNALTVDARTPYARGGADAVTALLAALNPMH